MCVADEQEAAFTPHLAPRVPIPQSALQVLQADDQVCGRRRQPASDQQQQAVAEGQVTGGQQPGLQPVQVRSQASIMVPVSSEKCPIAAAAFSTS